MFRPQDRAKCQQLFQKYYTGRKFHDSLYRDMILEHLRPGQSLLDAGCGRYLKFCRDMSSVAGFVVGIDLETRLETENRTPPFGACADVCRLPFASESFDVVISRCVVEHLKAPRTAFQEFNRVLRPGGKAIIITPNKYDYVSMIAILTPYRIHRALVSRIFQIPDDDIFPTLYRANTVGAIRRALKGAGFVEKHLDTINHYPAYLMFSPVLFQLGVLYEKLTSLGALRGLRGSILAVFEKPGPATRVFREEDAGAAAVKVS